MTWGPFTVAGTSGDGKLTLLGAALAALGLWRWSAGRRPRLALAAVTVVAFLSTALAVYHAIDLSTEGDGIGLGWGLVVAVVAAAVLTGLCVVQLRQKSAETVQG